jgi:hypothetical protein
VMMMAMTIVYFRDNVISDGYDSTKCPMCSNLQSKQSFSFICESFFDNTLTISETSHVTMTLSTGWTTF